MRKRKDMDDTGLEIEVDVPFPIWVKPKAGGGTPMCGALRRARDLAEYWAYQHPDSYPPVIVNVTDGEATDGDPTGIAQEIYGIATNDGKAMIFNVYCTRHSDAPIDFEVKVHVC